MEVIKGNIYDYPDYYDLVYGSDWEAEFEFLTACFAKFCPAPPKLLFEPACGTGRLLYRFAEAGYDVCGLDLNEKSIEFCNHRLEEIGSPKSGIVADMSQHVLATPADAAFNTINSFRHLQTDAQAKSHLECIADSLTPGGIYVLGLHLYPESGETVDEENWSAQRDDLQVNTQLKLVRRDLENRQEHFQMWYDIYKPSGFFQIHDEISFRTYTAPQFQSLVDSVKGLDVEAIFDFSYEIDAPIEIVDSTEDVVFILKKK